MSPVALQPLPVSDSIAACRRNASDDRIEAQCQAERGAGCRENPTPYWQALADKCDAQALRLLLSAAAWDARADSMTHPMAQAFAQHLPFQSTEGFA